MTLFSRRAAARLIAAAGFALALSAPSLAQSRDRQDGMGRDAQELVQRLRVGGYVIVVRHGATVSNQADTDPFNFDDVTKQRNLNDKGKELARRLAMRFAGSVCLSGRSTRASSIAPTRRPSWQAAFSQYVARI